MCRSHSLWRRVMFVCRITQKLHDRFPQNSDGGLVSAQNRSHRPLVQIQIKDTDGLRCRWCHHAAEVPTWMPFRRTKCGGVPSLHYKYITTGGGIFFYLVHPCTLNILHCPGIFSHFLWHPEHFFFYLFVHFWGNTRCSLWKNRPCFGGWYPWVSTCGPNKNPDIANNIHFLFDIIILV